MWLQRCYAVVLRAGGALVVWLCCTSVSTMCMHAPRHVAFRCLVWLGLALRSAVTDGGLFLHCIQQWMCLGLQASLVR